jgi:hypothetical protein
VNSQQQQQEQQQYQQQQQEQEQQQHQQQRLYLRAHKFRGWYQGPLLKQLMGFHQR